MLDALLEGGIGGIGGWKGREVLKGGGRGKLGGVEKRGSRLRVE